MRSSSLDSLEDPLVEAVHRRHTGTVFLPLGSQDKRAFLLMGALGVAIPAKKSSKRQKFDFAVENMEFHTREASCGQCSNHREINRGDELIDARGARKGLCTFIRRAAAF